LTINSRIDYSSYTNKKQGDKNMYHRLTAITFPNWDDAISFVQSNYENWAILNIDGINKSEELFPVYNQETFELIGVTVVFAKKIKRPIKEVYRRDCARKIDDLGHDWIPLKLDGVFTLQHGRTGKYFKGIKAKSWRGLLRVIKTLSHSYRVACIEYKETGWLKKYEVI
jgi:hypothetical protein